MKNLKFHTIVLGFISLTSIPHVHAMERKDLINAANTTLTAVASATAQVAAAAKRGLLNMTIGPTDLLIDAIKNDTVSDIDIERNHQADWAVRQEVKNNNCERLLDLLAHIQKHNTKHPTKMIEMSPQCEAMIRTPLETYYAKLEQAVLTETDSQVKAMLKRWKEEREELIALAEVERAKLNAISKTIRLVQGTSPDDMQLYRELDALLAKKRCDEHILIPAPVRSNDTSKSEKSTQTHQDDEIDTSKTHNSISTTTTTTTATASKSDLVPTKQDAAIPSPSKGTPPTILEEKSNTVPALLPDAASSIQHDDDNNGDDDDDDTETPSSQSALPQGTTAPTPTSVTNRSQASNRSKKKKKVSNNNLAVLQHQ